MKLQTYGARNDESREEIPYSIEGRRKNGCNVVVGSQAHSHHSIKSEVKECEVHEEQIPEEFSNSPLESDHGINYYTIYQSLDENIRNFNCNL